MLKRKRLENKMLKQSYYSKKCLVCGKMGSDPAHLKTVGSGGDDTSDNLIPLCRQHHTEQHQIGIGTFCLKYSQVEDHIEKLGWECITVNGVNRIRPKFHLK